MKAERIPFGWDAGKFLVETPKQAILVKIAGGGRQREVIREMSANTQIELGKLKMHAYLTAVTGALLVVAALSCDNKDTGSSTKPVSAGDSSATSHAATQPVEFVPSDPAYGTKPKNLSRDEIVELVLAATGEMADQKAAQRLVELGAPCLELLVNVLGMDNHGIEVDNATNLLVRIGPPAIPALIQAMRDGVGRHGATPARLLGKLGDSRAIPALIKALDSPSPLVKYHASWALGELRAVEAQDILKKLLNDPEPLKIDTKELPVTFTANFKDKIRQAIEKIQLAVTAETYAAQIQAMLSDDWTVETDKNAVTVTRRQPVEWYNSVSLPTDDKAELKRDGYIQSGPYVIRLELMHGFTVDEVDWMKKDNEWITKKYYERNPPPPGKPGGIPKALKKRLHKVPNVLGQNFTVLQTSNISGWMRFFDDSIAEECEGVVASIRTLLTAPSSSSQ